MRMAAAALLLAGCATAESPIHLGGEWRVADLNGAPAIAPAPTIRLTDGQASGTGGCNNWSGPYERGAKERIQFGSIAATEMACAPAVMEQERRFFDLLARVRGYSLYGDGSLSLIASDGSAMRLRR